MLIAVPGRVGPRADGEAAHESVRAAEAVSIATPVPLELFGGERSELEATNAVCAVGVRVEHAAGLRISAVGGDEELPAAVTVHVGGPNKPDGAESHLAQGL